MQSSEIEIRVRYVETDPMGFLHHAHYFTYFEMGRTELLRSQGWSYREIEERGYFIVVVKIACRFRQPARYDDVLTLRTWLKRVTRARIEHHYELWCGESLLAEAESTLACVDREGKLQLIPEELTTGEDE
jgi:acyl-CoA thioester hydrolase